MLKFIVYFLILIFFLLFGLANEQIVELSLIPKLLEFSLPLYLLIFISFLIGLTVSYIYHLYKATGYKVNNFLKTRKIKKLEKEEKKLTIEHEKS